MSVWLAKRGVVPVQCKVTKTEKSGFVFVSLHGYPWSDEKSFSALIYKPSEPMMVADINQLIANFDDTTGQSIGGSLRWGSGSGPRRRTDGNGIDLADVVDNRVEATQVSGAFYDNWTHVRLAWGELAVKVVKLDGLTAGTYRVYIDVNGDGTVEPGYGQFSLK
jgi:hypothetical protein